MSAYDDAVAYLDAEVHPRCDYDIYSDMRDIVDEMEAENAKLRELVRELYNRLNDSDENCGECRSSCDYDAWNFGDPKCIYAKRVRELGIGVDA